ncbi:MAG TPA: discoidin domain-containing protein, partial [Methylococcaceae bacterium]|nr:discoidin domain-containing protein [Methylococcaceae bacterium]
LQTSGDGVDWCTIHQSERAAGEFSYLYLPGCATRYLRLELPPNRGGYGIIGLALQSFEFSRSLNTFFQHVAQSGPRGLYPRYLHGEQSYWTPVGVPDGTTRALLNEEGLLEPSEGSFSLEPFLFVDGQLVTWADVQPLPGLEDDYLPIPSVRWDAQGWRLTITAFAVPEGQYVRYRLENTAGQPRALRFFVAIRPFQVNPPWQAFGNLGGVSPIRKLAWRESAVWVNGAPAVRPLADPDGFGAAAFEEGSIGEYLRLGALPERTAVTDDFGFASGACRYDVNLEGDASWELFLAMPSTAASRAVPSGAAAFRQAVETWRQRLNKVDIQLPHAAQDAVNACKTAAAHILVNRHGAALQPGPRRYTRAWMRDGAIMAAALLRMGCGEAARDFLHWYAPFQKADGNVPAIVDRTGPDWLAEHDSHGQFVFAVLEYYRFSGDRVFLEEMRAAALKAAAYLEELRRQRLTNDYLAPDKRACYGLLPESVSHEGYLAHPVHAYWDDFWALQGFRDAAHLADLLDDGGSAARFDAQYRELQDNLAQSVAAVMAERHIDFIPGSVEWADFDPTATANAIAQLDGLAVLPADAVRRTLDMYLQHFRSRLAGQGQWSNYSPYEIRVIGALVRVGMRAEAQEVLEFFLSDRRPPAWNQWPEIAWRDPRTPGHIGDIPHTWISAEYILSLLSLFAYERAEDQALVLGAGIWPEWLDSEEGVAVRGLPTRYGVLDYRFGRDADGGLVLRLSGALREPPGGIVLRLPADAADQNVRTESPWPVRVETDSASGQRPGESP